MLFLCVVGLLVPTAVAQAPAGDGPRIRGDTFLRNVINPRISGAVDFGPVAGEMDFSQITLMFRRTAEQHSALDRLLREQQDPSSPNYRRWLTPEEFADRFGPARETIEKVKAWLQSAGLTVKATARAHGWIVFSGTASQIQNAFRVEIRRYKVGGRTHYAPSSAPAIPADLAPFVAAIRGLDDFHPLPRIRVRPMYTAPDGSHALAPGDIATIYDLDSLLLPSWNAGSGQTIAVVGASDIDVADIQLFRRTFQLPANDPQLLLAGDDPGVDQDAQLEADADIEWAGSLAPGATIIYAYSTDVFASAQYVIDQNLAQVLVFTYGECEPNVSPGDAAAIQDLAQQANAQGITWVAAPETPEPPGAIKVQRLPRKVSQSRSRRRCRR